MAGPCSLSPKCFTKGEYYYNKQLKAKRGVCVCVCVLGRMVGNTRVSAIEGIVLLLTIN